MKLPCTDCSVDLYAIREYSYVLKKWAFGKAVLCVKCLENRLGRQLTKADFNFKIPLTNLPFARSPLLESRLK